MNTFGFEQEKQTRDLKFYSINDITIFHITKLLEKAGGLHRNHYDFIRGCYACEASRCLELLNKQIEYQKKNKYKNNYEEIEED